VLVCAAGSFVPILACALWFWLRGAWTELAWTLFEFTPGYTKLGWHGTPLGLFLYGYHELFTGFSYVLPVCVPLAIVLPRVAPREREGVFVVAAIASIQVAGIAMQAKFFQYHYSATLLLVSFVAGLGIYKVWRLATRVPIAGPLAVAGALGWLVAARVALRHNPGTYWERSADRLRFLVLRDRTREELDAKLYHVVDYDLGVDRRAARELAHESAPDDRVFVWGFEPVLYWLADRAPASRYLYSVPQRAKWQSERARAELMSDLARTPPKVLFVGHGDVFPFVTGDDRDSFASLDTFPALATLVDDEYDFTRAIGHLDVYSRRR
jgi:hypothetical protein